MRGMAKHHIVENVLDDLKNNTTVEVIRPFKMDEWSPTFPRHYWTIYKLNKAVGKAQKQ